MNDYKTEDEFLKAYDSSKFDKLSMTTDILIISVSSLDKDNYRKLDSKKLSILLVKRDDFPYKDKWCLPGGFLDPKTETLEECAKRVLKKETNLSDIYLEQLYTFDSIDRDPRLRVVSTSFLALIDKNRIKDKIKNASWFDIIEYSEDRENVNVLLSNGIENIELCAKKEYKKDSTHRYDYKCNNYLAFDHDKIVFMGLKRINNKVLYTDIAFQLVPEYFTLKELQQVYEVILNKKLLDPAFRRIINNKVEKTERMKTGEGHRPSYLFRYKKHERD